MTENSAGTLIQCQCQSQYYKHFVIIINLHTITTYSSHNVDNESASPNSIDILVTKGPKLARA